MRQFHHRPAAKSGQPAPGRHRGGHRHAAGPGRYAGVTILRRGTVTAAGAADAGISFCRPFGCDRARRHFRRWASSRIRAWWRRAPDPLVDRCVGLDRAADADPMAGGQMAAGGVLPVGAVFQPHPRWRVHFQWRAACAAICGRPPQRDTWRRPVPGVAGAQPCGRPC
ncbi:hypothetical protein G6F31_019147 [Rhizopus arrhizus]|nr:hypothetical protein G6F31_019147 [Rhizopus arrhizus]